jgi:sugar/nucleoside kinase (ribokinase family)
VSYLLIGHLTADLTPEGGRRLGGTVSYAARVAAAFGLPVRLLTSAVPDDPLMAELAPYVTEQAVIPAAATSTFENIYDAEGHRTQYVRGAAAPIGVGDVHADWLTTPLVHLAPLTGEVDPQLAHLFRDSTVLLTLQGWLRCWGADGRVYFKRWFDPAVLADIDVVVFSEEDIAEAPDLEAAFAAAVPHLFVTRAEKGGTYYFEGQPQAYATPQLAEVNSTGAGDVFAAAVLCCMSRLNGDMSAVTQVAARLGANAITRPWLDGAPTVEEVQSALELEQLRRKSI